jgi:hypothetical protein
MTNRHSKIFFGRKASLILTSSSKRHPYIILSCIYRKDDGTWEEIDNDEGRSVKLTIEEIICILEVLKKKIVNWSGYHIFKEKRAEIYVGWEDESRQVLVMKIDGYHKKLQFPNLNLLIQLLEHILSEKIEFGTDLDEKKTLEEYGIFSEYITTKDGLQVVETTRYDPSLDAVQVKAIIRVESPKALLIMLDSGEEFWIPKSTIHSNYDISNNKGSQKLVVDRWIIDKNKVKK